MWALEWFRPWLQTIGENPNRPALIDTPRRMAEAFTGMLSGYGDDPAKHFGVLFDEPEAKDPITVEFPFYSICEHHVLPFYGTIRVQYLPANRKIVGLSKIPRGAAANPRAAHGRDRAIVCRRREAGVGRGQDRGCAHVRVGPRDRKSGDHNHDMHAGAIMSAAEVAEALGLHIKSVRRIEKRALRKLAKLARAKQMRADWPGVVVKS